jgi:hypothetical protein
MPNAPRNLALPGAIAGFVLAEVYMLFTALGPNLKDAAVPWEAQIMRVLVLAVFFGPFGAAAGTGVGLLATALWGLVRRFSAARRGEQGQ